MKFNEESKIIYFKKTKLSQQQIDNLYIPRDYQKICSSITRYNGEYYYYKDVTLNSLINELIGSYFSKKLQLDTVDYQIGVMDNMVYVLSKIFYQENFNYYDCNSYFKTSSFHNIDLFQSFFSFIYLSEFDLLKKIKNPNLLKNILKLIAVDLKMGQFDRHNKNLFLKISQDNIVDLAPLFDYGGSYYKKKIPFEIYDNPLVSIRKNKRSLCYFSEQFPEFLEYIYTLYEITINDVLNNIEKEHLITFEKEERTFYQKKDLENNKVLKKIMD